MVFPFQSIHSVILQTLLHKDSEFLRLWLWPWGGCLQPRVFFQHATQSARVARHLVNNPWFFMFLQNEEPVSGDLSGGGLLGYLISGQARRIPFIDRCIVNEHPTTASAGGRSFEMQASIDGPHHNTSVGPISTKKFKIITGWGSVPFLHECSSFGPPPESPVIWGN